MAPLPRSPLGLFAADEDLVSFDGVTFSPFFDGSAEGLADGLDLDGASYDESGGLLQLSLDGSGTVGGLDFDDEDILEFDSSGPTWSLAYDGSVEHAALAAADINVVPEPGQLVSLVAGVAGLWALSAHRAKRLRRSRPRAALWLLAGPGLAVDGVLEINQACAVNTGCFAGDTAGFPVTVSQSGSYRLTSDLVVPAGASGISEAAADDVSIDLNGFSIIGPGPPAAAADGIHLSQAKNWEIRGGTVRDFTNRGIADATATAEGHRIIGVRLIANSSLGISLGGTGHLIKGCTIQNNLSTGVAPGANGLLIGNVIEGNGGDGINFNGLGNGYGDNVINANAGTALAGSAAVQISGNVCNAVACP